MKNLILLPTLLCSLLTIHLSSQPCLPEGIHLTNQAQVDSFQVNYPNCTEIEGDVFIYGADITNLSGLSTITSIEGKLVIGDDPYPSFATTSLLNLSGLDNLNSIGDNLTILNNDSLESLAGLENLNSIGGNLRIGSVSAYSYPNPSLFNISALGSLTSVGGSIWIEVNPALVNLTGLENINSIESLHIHGNGLTSLTGLNNLVSIDGGGVWWTIYME